MVLCLSTAASNKETSPRPSSCSLEAEAASKLQEASHTMEKGLNQAYRTDLFVRKTLLDAATTFFFFLVVLLLSLCDNKMERNHDNWCGRLIFQLLK